MEESAIFTCIVRWIYKKRTAIFLRSFYDVSYKQ